MNRGYRRLLCLCIASSTTRSTFGFVVPSCLNSSVVSTAASKRSISKMTTTSSLEQTIKNDENNNNAEQQQSSASASWRALLEASIAMTRKKKLRGSNYVQLATVTEEGEPRVRTVVFRGFLNLPQDHALSNNHDNNEKMSCIFKMCTDARSQKVTQKLSNSSNKEATSEVVWWFPKSSEQYRVRGDLLLIGADTDDRELTIARKELWGNLSDPARESFLDTTVPGDAFSEIEEEGASSCPVPVGGRDEEGKVVPPPDNFLLMLLDPTNVDYLKLTGAQYRQMDARGPSGWSLQRVNP